MLELKQDGFGLAELLVTLTLSGFVASALISFVIMQQRAHLANLQRFDRVATLRDAAAFVPSELREMNPSDSAGSDIVGLSNASIRYKAMRSVRFICRPPDTTARSVVTGLDWLGLRDLDPAADSLLVFAAGDITRPDDDSWLHADALSVVPATCLGGSAGREIALAGVSPADLMRVHVGAPVRAHALMEIRSYRDSRGQWWVGMARYGKLARRWASIQPLLGPIAPNGLTFTAFDRLDAPVRAAASARSIGIRVHPFEPGVNAGVATWLLPEIRVALRNSR